MDIPKEKSPTTILDLNLDVLEEIFKALRSLIDQISLGMTHPYLAEAFAQHARRKHKEIDIHNFTEEQISFILKRCGKHVENVRNCYLFSCDLLLTIVENCPNVNDIEICIKAGSVNGKELATTLARLPLKRLKINELNMLSIIKLLKRCKTLRKLILFKSEDFDISSIRTILKILEKNGVTLDDRFKLEVNRERTNLAGDLIFNMFKCKNHNLLSIKPYDDYSSDSSIWA